MSLYQILKSAHSGWRYLVFLLLVVAVISALSGWLSRKNYTAANRKLNVFTMVSVHIQFLLGLVLYFLSPLTKLPASDALGRYWKMEHIGTMLIAVILITIGNSRSKKALDGLTKHKSIAIFFGLGLILIIAAIVMMTKVGPVKTFFGMSAA